jgi:hypothetical protein
MILKIDVMMVFLQFDYFVNFFAFANTADH